jgi:bacteriorhodopsin
MSIKHGRGVAGVIFTSSVTLPAAARWSLFGVSLLAMLALLAALIVLQRLRPDPPRRRVRAGC